MKLTQRQLFLLKEIVSKAKFNELTRVYTIYPKDYLFYNLNKRTLKILERLCNKYNICVEKLPDRISNMETEYLFNRYNELKMLFEDTCLSGEKETIEKEMIEVKQKIVLGYMEVMYRIINKEFVNLIKEDDYEDVYQLGYEVLTWSVDKFDVNRGMTFHNYIKQILIHRLAEKIWIEKRNVKRHEARELINLLPIKDYEEISEFEILKIKENTNISDEVINHLLLKINNSYEVSTYDLIDDYLMVDGFEDDVLNKIEKEDILILLDTLPDIQKQIIKLYYGFVDGDKHSNEEIAQILGYNNRDRIRQIKEDALATLSMKIYSNVYNSGYFDDSILKERCNKIGKVSRYKREEELEDIIINSFSKEKLIDAINGLSNIYKSVFCLYYGLEDCRCLSIKEISLLLDKEQNIIRERKRKAVRLVAEKLCNNKNFSYPDDFVKKYIRMMKYEKKIKQ